MLPDRVSNPGPLTYESGALPIALRGPASCLSYKHFRRFAPLKNTKMQSCQHDIAKSILALGFKLLEN